MTMAQFLTTVMLPAAVTVLGWAAILLRLRARVDSLIRGSQGGDGPQAQAAARPPGRPEMRG